MKKAAKTRIIIWSVVCALLIAVLAVNIVIFNSGIITFRVLEPGAFKLISAPEDISDYAPGSSEIPADKVKSLDIDWNSGSVEFSKAKDEKITFSEDAGENDQMLWLLDSDGTLHIRFSKYENTFFGIFQNNVSGSKNLTVNIPANKSFETVGIDLAGADFSADMLAADELDIDSASGNIFFGSFSSNLASVETVSGNIRLSGSVDNKLTAESVSGDAKIYADFAEANLETVSGKYEIYLGEKAKKLSSESVSGCVTALINKGINGFTLDRDNISGSITNEFSVASENDKMTFGDGSTEISIETVSGDVILKPVDKKPELPAE